MRCGLYVLPAGGHDPEGPHTEDEIYHILRGRARLEVGGEDGRVGPGTIVFVGAGIEHQFHSIEEDWVTLVIFAPAEGSLGSRTTATAE